MISYVSEMNRSDKFISKSKHTMEFALEGVLMTSIAFVGIISNLFSFLYFIYQKDHKTFHRLLLLLGLVDTVHLLTSLLSFSFPTLSQNYYKSTYFYTIPYTLPLAQTSMVMSVYMTISLTVERYMSVVHPLYTLRHRSKLSTLYLSLPGVIFSILFTCPNYFLLSSEHFPLSEDLKEDDLSDVSNMSMYTDFIIQSLYEGSTFNLSIAADEPKPLEPEVSNKIRVSVDTSDIYHRLEWSDLRDDQTFVTVFQNIFC